MDLIVTGGRDYDDWAMLQEVLGLFDFNLLIQGGATGADAMARDYAKNNGIECVTVQANWDKYGKSAGPMRNTVMLQTYPNAVVVAFPGGKGTDNCMKTAVSMNRIVLRVEP